MGQRKISKKPAFKVYYCKSLKSTGQPIVVQDMEKNSEYSTDKIEFKNVNVKMTFNNADGKAKNRGATTILEIYLDITCKACNGKGTHHMQICRMCEGKGKIEH